jgi:hypothetical protein
VNGGVKRRARTISGGGDSLLIAGNIASAPKLFRPFGDGNGSSAITASDFNAFRLDYRTSGISIFDFDNNLLVTAADFGQFRNRDGLSLAR